MSYRKAMFLAIVCLVAAAGYDLSVVLPGKVHLGSYIPGIWPFVCIGCIVWIQMLRAKGLWNSPDLASVLARTGENKKGPPNR